MSTDNLVTELITLLKDMLASQQRLLQISILRQEAMKNFEIDRLTGLQEQERIETQSANEFENRRKKFVYQFRQQMGFTADPSVGEIARHAPEPLKSQLLSLAGQLKSVVEQLERNTRINAKISETVVKGLAKVLKIVTGLAQHAGLYMRNGRKAALKGIHLLEVTG